MGAFLDKPKTEKQTARGEGNGIRYGVSAMQGWRMEMEDAHVCETEMPFDKNSCFFGIFDGHAGPKVAQYCSEKLLHSIKECYTDSENTDGSERLKSAIHDGFIKIDSDMKSKSPWSDSKDRSGTTAVVTVITPEYIMWGNCGDSRGLLCRDGKVEFATADHKPFNETERSRIEKAGGTVMMQRVNGSLAVSRALGDFDYKRGEHLRAEEQLVSPEPEITETPRDHEKDHFLLLACDGIFDVMTNEDVAEYVQHQLRLTADLDTICSSLIDRCLNKNSRDNMSVILVVFPKAPKVSEEAIEEEKKRTEECDKLIQDNLERLIKEASDAIDLEENQVLYQLGEVPELKARDCDVHSRRTQIVRMLDEKRKEKFGQIEDSPRSPGGFFENSSSDAADAPRDWGESPMSTSEPFGQLGDSDTTNTMEGINSTTVDKTKM